MPSWEGTAMELHLVRLVLQNADNRNQEIRLDLVIEGRMIKGGLEYFGLWEDRYEDARCPFVLGPDGKVDFGTGYDGADRYYETNIGSLELTIGQQVGWRNESGDQTFRITGITPLL